MNKQAKVLINMVLAEPFWTPEPYQIIRFRNTNKLNSLWLGTVAPIILLPTRIWHEIIMVALMGHFMHSLRMMAFVPISMFHWFWWGVTGQAHAINQPLSVLTQSHFLSPADCLKAIAAGCDEVVMTSLAARSRTAENHDIEGAAK